MELTDEVRDIVARTRELVDAVVLPVEDEHAGDIEAAGGDAVRIRLQAAARDAGVFGPHVPRDLGGLGLGMVDRAPVFEEAGYSLFGAVALNIAAPDEGNVHLLDHVADEGQRERYLQPLARGDVRSAFSMTEPAPGAGADPTMLATRATRRGGRWVINGEKRFITGADGAAFFIVMARTSGDPGDGGGATMFLVPADRPGVDVGRHIVTSDRSTIGGHCEMTFHDVEVADDEVLGEVDRGFDYAQVRLAPARMTHVMRWLGSARRAHEIAVRYVAERDAFGSRLSELGLAQQQIADNEIDLSATRALMLEACADIDAGRRANRSSSVAKAFGAEAIFRVVDRSMQLCGGLGVSEDLPVARLAREVRPFRIYDGPSEVHRWSIARRAVRAILAQEARPGSGQPRR